MHSKLYLKTLKIGLLLIQAALFLHSSANSVYRPLVVAILHCQVIVFLPRRCQSEPATTLGLHELHEQFVINARYSYAIVQYSIVLQRNNLIMKVILHVPDCSS
jgi:hypothetical protein